MACNYRSQLRRKARLSDEQKEAERVRGEALRRARRKEWGPEKRAEAYARSAAWRAVNAERHQRVSREWYVANIEYARAAKRAEYYANPEKFYANNLIRKARINNAVCEHGTKCVTAAFLKSLYDSTCLYCDHPAAAADHFNPLARGGLHCVENLVPACQACNSSKQASEPIKWLISVGILIRK